MIHRILEFGHFFACTLGIMFILNWFWLATAHWLLPSSLGVPDLPPAWLQMVALVLASLLMVHVLQMLARWDERDYPRCSGCDYDLTGHQAVLGHPDARCPECGLDLSAEHIVPARATHPDAVRLQSLRLAVVFAVIWTCVLALYVGPWSWMSFGLCAVILWGWPVLVGFGSRTRP